MIVIQCRLVKLFVTAIRHLAEKQSACFNAGYPKFEIASPKKTGQAVPRDDVPA